MKPKEKANYLVSKIFRSDISIHINIYRSRKIAKILVDEILEATKGMVDEVFEEGMISSNEYWLQVKEEIDNANLD